MVVVEERAACCQDPPANVDDALVICRPDETDSGILKE
jgi:hypothetical protein